MKLNIKHELRNLNGDILTLGQDAQKENLTVGIALANILLAPRQDKSPQNKARLYLMSRKLYEAKTKDIEIETADLQMLREFCESDVTYGALVTGQLLDILEKIKE